MKLKSDENYIPISVRIDPELFIRSQLKADQQDAVSNCRKELAKLVCQQA